MSYLRWGAALIALLPNWALPACTATSGANTTALVELYTSEGCSSCPPAETMLNQLPSNGAAIPLALHVPYWDYLGWRDAFASPVFEERQTWLAGRNHRRGVYTPEVFVAGAELPDWSGQLTDAVRELNHEAARAKIVLSADKGANGGIAVKVVASAASTSAAALYVAVTEDGISTQVRAGENAGRQLPHEHVVRQWLGPFALIQGQAHVEQQLSVSPGWNRQRSGLVAFVEDRGSGEVLQAVACARGEY